MTITPLEMIVSRADIQCLGDIIPFNCSIESNSDTLHLTWRITLLLTGMTVNITHDNTSSINHFYQLNNYISSSLTQFMSDEYIESNLNIIVAAEILVSQIKIECLIGNTENDTVYASVNTSGIIKRGLIN